MFKVLSDIEEMCNADKSFAALNVPATESKSVLAYEFRVQNGILRMIPLFDIHYGLMVCDEARLEDTVKYILYNDDCVGFIGGDACEVATKMSVGMGVFDERYHAGDQRRKLTNILKPLAKKNKLLFGLDGNHEFRAKVFNDDSPIEEICYDLDIPYCQYQAYATIIVNGISYTMFAHHGTSGATTVSGKMASAAKCANVAIADVYITGHTHTRATWDDNIFQVVNGQVVRQRRVYVVGGSFVGYFNAYPELKNYPPSNLGVTMIGFHGDRKYISVTI